MNMTTPPYPKVMYVSSLSLILEDLQKNLQNTQKTTNYQQNLVTICLAKVSKTLRWALDLETFAKRLWTLPHFG